MSPGQQVVTAYFVLFYLVPLIGNSMFGERIFTIYTVAPLTSSVFMLLMSVLSLFLFLSMGPRVRIIPPHLFPAVEVVVRWMGAAYRKSRLAFALVCLPIALSFVVSGANSFRYSYSGIAETESVGSLLVIVLNVIVTVDLFYCMFVGPYAQSALSPRRRVENILLASVLVLTASGTAGMLTGLMSLAYSFWPAWFARILFPPRHQGIVAKIRRATATLTLVVGVFGMAWIAGETIKLASAGQTRDLLSASVAMREYVERTPDLIRSYGYYLLSAFSSHYYSLLFTADTLDGLTINGESALAFPIQSLMFRFGYLSGGLVDAERPDIGSLSRLNYMLLTEETHASTRQGTSPGLIASFNYVFPFPLNVILCGLYLSWVSWVINRLLYVHRRESLSMMGIFLLLFFVLVFFQSPFDWILLFDNVVLYVALIVGLALVPHPIRASSLGEAWPRQVSVSGPRGRFDPLGRPLS